MTWTYLTTRTDLEPGDWLDTGKGAMVVRERVSASRYVISKPTWRDHVRAFCSGAWHGFTDFWWDIVFWVDDRQASARQRKELLRAGLARPPADFWRLIIWRLGF